jgi:hypothetical protein
VWEGDIVAVDDGDQTVLDKIERELSRAEPDLVSAFYSWRVSGLPEPIAVTSTRQNGRTSSDDTNPVAPLRWQALLVLIVSGVVAVALVLLVGAALAVLAVIAVASLWYLPVLGPDNGSE